MGIEAFLDEVRQKNRSQFEHIDRLVEILDTLVIEEAVTVTYSVTSGNQ